MSYVVLARKWRPKKFEEIIGQEHIARSLKNSITNNQVGHAYLLTGTRGIGKTSAARIFAKSLTCTNLQDDGNPCLECSQCLSVDNGSSIDVAEIDGASNNGVENIRQLIENLQYLPVNGRYKVYIIDEVHMLSTSAFNALLKTLEEPPKHVVFILATTDPEKLLHTVLSRCQRFDFRNASNEALTNHLNNVLKSEEIELENEKLVQRIAKMARGSFRDALSLVDQVLTYSVDKKITEETLSHALGVAKTSSLATISTGILKGDAENVISVFRECLEENIDLKSFTLNLLDYLFFIVEKIDHKNQLYNLKVIEKGSLDDISMAEIFWIYENLSKDLEWAIESLIPEKSMELILRKVSLRRSFFQKKKTSIAFTDAVESSPEQAEDEISSTEETTIVSEELISPDEVSVEVVTAEITEVEEPPLVDEEVNTENRNWESFLEWLGGKHPVIRANLEQGNLISDVEKNSSGVFLSLGFDETSRVFAEYVEEKGVKTKIEEILATFFEVEQENLNFEVVNLDNEIIEKTNFKSISQRKDEEEKKEEEIATQGLLNNQFIKEAESLFNSKIDKVVLDKKQ